MTYTLQQIQNKYPYTYSQILREGVLIERRRVLTHLDIASAYHVLDYAIKEIRNGSPDYPTLSLHDQYAEIEDNRDDELEEYEKECIAKGWRSWL